MHTVRTFLWRQLLSNAQVFGLRNVLMLTPFSGCGCMVLMDLCLKRQRNKNRKFGSQILQNCPCTLECSSRCHRAWVAVSPSHTSRRHKNTSASQEHISFHCAGMEGTLCYKCAIAIELKHEQRLFRHPALSPLPQH